MTETIHDALDRIAKEPLSLRSYVGEYARDTRDPDFFLDLNRFPEGRDILSLFADTKRCRKFFDTRYEEITAVLTDMRAEGQLPDFIPDGDLRCWLAESAFLYIARQIAREIGVDDEA